MSIIWNTFESKTVEKQAEPITEARETTILRCIAILTDQKMINQARYVVVKDYKRETCFLIEMSVPTDNYISTQEYNKISKYKQLEIAIEKM